MKIYKSEIGLEMYITLTLMCLLNIYILITTGFDFVLIPIIFSPLLLIIYVINETNYRIKDDVLFIKSSFFFNETLPIKEIRKIEEVTSLLSAPAMSIKRLELFYATYDSLLISPKNKKEFIEVILAINKNIEVKLKK